FPSVLAMKDRNVGSRNGGGRDDGKSLRHVRAGQLRAKAIAWGIGNSVLVRCFLLRALSYAFGPDPRAPGSLLWMAMLLLLSTINVGLGLRTFSRVRRRAARFWLPATLTWGVLGAVLLLLLC